jgi:poly(hydroxyalkanoate) granule-associated protein
MSEDTPLAPAKTKASAPRRTSKKAAAKKATARAGKSASKTAPGKRPAAAGAAGRAAKTTAKRSSKAASRKPITKRIEIRSGTPTPSRRPQSLPELIRRVVFDAAGAAPGEAERLVRELLKRGDLPKPDADRILRELRNRTERATESARRGMQGGAEELVSMIDQRVESILTRLNIPTRKDIHHLNQSIDNLTRRVEQLTRGGRSAS